MKIYTLCVDLVDNERILSSSKREVVEEVEKLILNDIKNLKELLCEKYREQFFNDESNIEQFEHTSYKNMEEFLRNSVLSSSFGMNYINDFYDMSDLYYFSTKYPEYKYLKLIDDNCINSLNKGLVDMFIVETYIVDTVEEFEDNL